MSKAFKDFFFKAYLDFQAETRERTVTAFAKYLSTKNKKGVNFSQQVVSGWLNGDFEPGEKYIHALADVVGKNVYELLKISPPDPDLQFIKDMWEAIPEAARHKLADQAGRYAVGVDIVVGENENLARPAPKTS